MATPPQPVRFALGTFSSAGGPSFPGLVVDDRVADLGQVLPWRPASTLDVLERWAEALPLLRHMASDEAQEWQPLDGLHVHAPVAPRQVFQSGANYRQHVIDLVVAHRPADSAESEQQARARAAELMDRRAREDQPYVFIGLPSAITGPYDDVVLPSWCEQPDWELELTAVIGTPAHRVSPQEALRHVAGYTIANDLTARDLVFRKDMREIGTDWLRSKNAPGFTPLGPYVVPAEFVGDPADLRLTLRLNGDVMQDESTKDMIFGVARMVSCVSQTTTLLPGDLVLTGSPAGNGIHHGRLLRDGDVMESTITGLGAQRTRCVAQERA